jgi:hypothetical protein
MLFQIKKANVIIVVVGGLTKVKKLFLRSQVVVDWAPNSYKKLSAGKQT